MAIAAVIVLFICTAEYSRKETVRGFLVPSKGVIKAVATQGGVIDKIWGQPGYKLIFESSKTIIPERLMFAVLEHFSGQTIIGGFDRDDAPEGGIGLFVQDYSEAKLEKKITPLNGTHIVAILKDEGFVNVEKKVLK